MVENSELLRVPAFADLPDDQSRGLSARRKSCTSKRARPIPAKAIPPTRCSSSLKDKSRFVAKSAAKLSSFTIEAGQRHGSAAVFKNEAVLPWAAGQSRTVALLRFPAALFPELVQKMPELTKRLVGLMSDRIRETTRMEQQRDRLAALGKLSAGLAHELNNPASAAKRATSQLRDYPEKNQGCQPRTGPARSYRRAESGN